MGNCPGEQPWDFHGGLAWGTTLGFLGELSWGIEVNENETKTNLSINSISNTTGKQMWRSSVSEHPEVLGHV
jgi:hypothetical protein